MVDNVYIIVIVTLVFGTTATVVLLADNRSFLKRAALLLYVTCLALLASTYLQVHNFWIVLTGLLLLYLLNKPHEKEESHLPTWEKYLYGIPTISLKIGGLYVCNVTPLRLRTGNSTRVTRTVQYEGRTRWGVYTFVLARISETDKLREKIHLTGWGVNLKILSV